MSGQSNLAGQVAGMFFIRIVPAVMEDGLKKGTLKVVGSIIKDTATGRIVGHLQETRVSTSLQNIPSIRVGVSDPITAAANIAVGAANLGVNSVTLHKVNKIGKDVTVLKQGMERIEASVSILHKMGIADLALSAAGLGVSVAGFAVMSAKIDGLKRALESTSARIEAVSAKIDQLQHDAVAMDIADVRALAKNFDDAWLMADERADKQWHSIAQDLQRFQARFESRADRVLAGGTKNYLLADPLLDTLGLIGNVRVTALMANNEVAAARSAAADNAHIIERLTGQIGLKELSIEAFQPPKADPGTAAWLIAEADANQSARRLLRKLRHRQAAAYTRASPLDEIEHRGIHPRDWLEAARQETEAPLIITPRTA